MRFFVAHDANLYVVANKIMHVYGPKSTPIAQGLVEDINIKHSYGPRSAPIVQGLVYDINASHAFGLRESKRTYGFVSTPIAQGLVEIINAKDTKMVMLSKAQGLVSNTHHSKTCMVKYHTHDRMGGGKTTKRQNSSSAGQKMTSLDETNHVVVSLLPTEEDCSRMSGGKGAKRMNSGSAVKKTTFSDETYNATVSLLPKKEDSSRWVSTLVPLTLLTAAIFCFLMLCIARRMTLVSGSNHVSCCRSDANRSDANACSGDLM